MFDKFMLAIWILMTGLNVYTLPNHHNALDLAFIGLGLYFIADFIKRIKAVDNVK